MPSSESNQSTTKSKTKFTTDDYRRLIRIDAGSFDVWVGMRDRSTLHPDLRERLDCYDAMLTLFDALDLHRVEIARVLAGRR